MFNTSTGKKDGKWKTGAWEKRREQTEDSHRKTDSKRHMKVKVGRPVIKDTF